MFDVLTIAAITDELRQTVLDGRIQKIGLVDPLTFAAEIYAHGRRRALIASADPQRSRVLLAETLPSFDPNLITPFGLLLRKHVRGGFLIGIEQPPLERVVRLSIAKRAIPHNVEATATVTDETDEPDDDETDIWAAEGVKRVDLSIEVMGRHSNLILVDEDGLIMDSAKRVTTSMSRVRPVQPKREFVPPPPVDKPDPRRVTSASLAPLLQAQAEKVKLSDVLVRSMRGISPQTAREIAFRATGETSTRALDVAPDQVRDVAAHTRAMFEPLLTGTWDPHTYERDDVVVAFSALPLHHLDATAEGKAWSSMSQAAAQMAEEPVADMPQTHAQRRAQLTAIIDAEAGKISTRLASLEQQFAKAEDVDDLRTAGEMIYAYLWQIEPGQTLLDVDDLRIPLDPALSAKENAQAYFDKYRRSQRAGEHLPARIAEAEQDLAYLQQLRVQVAQADSFAALESLRAELYEWDSFEQEKSGKRQPKPKSDTGKRGPVLIDADGNAIHVGRSGKENDHVTFTVAGPDDTWLHARGVPGSHVIVKWRNPQDEDPEDTIEMAAALAGWYSGARDSGSVEVDVAKRRHVRKIKGGGPGMVTYRNERTILVKPQDESAVGKAMPGASGNPG